MTQPCPRFAHALPLSPGFVPFWDIVGKCTFCGSITPDALFEAIAGGAEIFGTKKNNKIFIRYVEVDPDTGRTENTGKAEDMFQFEHLNEAERERFVVSLNAENITFGYPGHLTTHPFFTGKVGDSFEVIDDGVPDL